MCCEAGSFCPLILFAEVSDISIDYQINEDIRDREVRLVDENGEQQGIVQLAVAMRCLLYTSHANELMGYLNKSILLSTLSRQYVSEDERTEHNGVII